MGLNSSLWLRKRVIKNSQIVYNRNILLNVLDAKFQVLFIFCSRLFLEEALRLFGLGPNCGHFGGFGDNNSGKQHIELKFWPQVVFIVVQILFKAFWKTRIQRQEIYTKFQFLVQLWPQFTPWRLPKSKIAIWLSK